MNDIQYYNTKQDRGIHKASLRLQICRLGICSILLPAYDLEKKAILVRNKRYACVGRYALKIPD